MTTEDRLKAIMFDYLNGKVTLIEALTQAYGAGYADGDDDRYHIELDR